MQMNKEVVDEVLSHISEHIVFDKGLQQICYSAQFVKTIEYIRKKIKEGKFND